MKDICIYGLGNYYYEHKMDIDKKYNVLQYFDKTKNMEGIKVHHNINDINRNIDILIMISKTKLIFEVIDELITNGFMANHIKFGIAIWGQCSNLDEIYVDDDAHLHICHKGIDIQVESEDEFENSLDTILNECYKYFCGNNDEIVFDIGMNIGDSTVYFAKMENVKKVYAFEPFEDTFLRARNNIVHNSVDEIVDTFCFGLSNVNETREIAFRKEMTCGQSTIYKINEYATGIYEDWGLLSKEEKNYTETIRVKKASEVLSELMLKYEDATFILKIDCEGEEFQIIEDLWKNQIVFNKISLIMMEWHYQSNNIILNYLKKSGFRYVSNIRSHNPEMGLIYAWKP